MIAPEDIGHEIRGEITDRLFKDLAEDETDMETLEAVLETLESIVKTCEELCDVIQVQIGKIDLPEPESETLSAQERNPNFRSW